MSAKRLYQGCTENKRRSVRWGGVVACFVGVMGIVSSAHARNAPLVVKDKPPVSHRSTRKPRGERTTLFVVVTAVNKASATLTPEGTKDATPLVAVLTKQTKFHRVSNRTTPPGLVVGERNVVRVETFPTDKPTTNAPDARGDNRTLVLEVWDVALYEEEQKRRKEVFAGVVRETLPPGTPSGTLVLADKDGTQVSFRVTEKTMFRKGGMPVAPAAYPPGSLAVVKPRALPSGGVMASIVAETETVVEIHYKDTLSVWEGLVSRVDGPGGYLVLQRSDGAERRVNLPCPPYAITDEKARKEDGVRRLYTLEELMNKPVKARLVRSERPAPNGARTAVEITVIDAISTTPASSGSKTPTVTLEPR